jgi:hypothetical protein
MAMARGNGFSTARAERSPAIKLETVAPDRNMLRSQLVALYYQYASDVEQAEAIQREYEEIIRDARKERRSALTRIGKLRRLLDDEFPGWDNPLTREA